MKIFIAISIIACAAIMGCGQPAPKPQPPVERYEKLPTATEVFELRTRCAKLATELDEQWLHGPAVHRETLSNYSAKSNRCYVTMDDETYINSPKYESLRILYDGQTGEQLAYTKFADGRRKIGELSENTVLFLDDCHEGGDCGYAKAEAWIDEKMKREDQ